ncbi:hypothetical protein BpHYR1_019680 [Brachionus plicatilis]|uniref:Uncharacterized protein n=1 Tax=Brachionus plicatilis TaxID=10195 RepID=A0A3M7RHK3_BRAPC|nr:hypothetical protein BpHYR1_019680 [Brachionus plicatilis]
MSGSSVSSTRPRTCLLIGSDYGHLLGQKRPQMLQINAVSHDDDQRVGPLPATALNVFDYELVANNTAIFVIIKKYRILEHLAMQSSETGLAHQREHLGHIGTRLAKVANLVGRIWKIGRVVIADVVVEIFVKCLARFAVRGGLRCFALAWRHICAHNFVLLITEVWRMGTGRRRLQQYADPLIQFVCIHGLVVGILERLGAKQASKHTLKTGL